MTKTMKEKAIDIATRGGVVGIWEWDFAQKFIEAVEKGTVDEATINNFERKVMEEENK